jgi:hypothetical protein
MKFHGTFIGVDLLEPDLLEYKYYARGVGVVLTVDVKAGNSRDELIRFSG